MPLQNQNWIDVLLVDPKQTNVFQTLTTFHSFSFTPYTTHTHTRSVRLHILMHRPGHIQNSVWMNEIVRKKRVNPKKKNEKEFNVYVDNYVSHQISTVIILCSLALISLRYFFYEFFFFLLYFIVILWSFLFIVHSFIVCMHVCFGCMCRACYILL